MQSLYSHQKDLNNNVVSIIYDPVRSRKGTLAIKVEISNVDFFMQKLFCFVLFCFASSSSFFFPYLLYVNQFEIYAFL